MGSAWAKNKPEPIPGEVKVQFVWRPVAGTTLEQHAAQWREQLGDRLFGFKRLAHTTEVRPTKWSLVPFKHEPVTLLSVWGGADVFEKASEKLQGLPGSLDAYRVVEEVAVYRPPVVKPGATMLTLLRQKPGLSRETFIDEWHRKHTPMAVAIHPFQGYVRNTVEAALSEAAPAYDGIVTEDFAGNDLFNPVKMFGGPLKMTVNMARVGLHVGQFLDMKTLANHVVVEHRL